MRDVRRCQMHAVHYIVRIVYAGRPRGREKKSAKGTAKRGKRGRGLSGVCIIIIIPYNSVSTRQNTDRESDIQYTVSRVERRGG